MGLGFWVSGYMIPRFQFLGFFFFLLFGGRLLSICKSYCFQFLGYLDFLSHFLALLAFWLLRLKMMGWWWGWRCVFLGPCPPSFLQESPFLFWGWRWVLEEIVLCL